MHIFKKACVVEKYKNLLSARILFVSYVTARSCGQRLWGVVFVGVMQNAYRNERSEDAGMNGKQKNATIKTDHKPLKQMPKSYIDSASQKKKGGIVK
jgi:hypothetical protein